MVGTLRERMGRELGDCPHTAAWRQAVGLDGYVFVVCVNCGEVNNVATTGHSH